jgi:peptidoglycan/xylan/chitin deacetylase (PgdA/CDA1 family)
MSFTVSSILFQVYKLRKNFMKKRVVQSLVLGWIVGFAFLVPLSQSLAAENDSPARNAGKSRRTDYTLESASSPEVTRTAPLSTPPAEVVEPVDTVDTGQFQLMAVPLAETVAPQNLIQNASFETATNGLPTGWTQDRWSDNNAVFTYPVTGFNGGKAAEVKISTYTSGDAKWYFDDVAVTPGKLYEFSNYSKSTTETELDIRYKMSDGSFTYKYIATVPASSTFTKNTQQFTVPANVVSMTVFHVLPATGTLDVDEYSLGEVGATPPPPPPPPTSGNLIVNPGLETPDSSGNPLSWKKDRWKTNSGSFIYPVAGVGGSKAVQVTITSYTSGDAKWYFNPVSVTPGTYTYTDQYISDKTTFISAQIQHRDGSFTYPYLGSFGPSSSFGTASGTFSVPDTAVNVTIFHVINQVGSLTIDNASLKKNTVTPPPPPAGIFSTGGVTLTFDDGDIDQYTTALPKLTAAGIKGTFYIISQRFSDLGFSGSMSKAQVKDLFNKGHEIAAHTRTHPHLTTMTQAQQVAEIQGSRQDLLAMNVGSIMSFAYPFGEYDATTLQVVKDAGFTSARSTIGGYATPTAVRLELPRQSLENTVTVAQVKQWIDTAIANKQWLIIAIHHVDTSGEQYSTTPDTFNQMIDYLVQKQVKTVTISEGVQSLR